MGYMGRKSQLKSDVIKKAILNKKDYVEGDYTFKVIVKPDTIGWLHSLRGQSNEFELRVFNFEKLILIMNFNEIVSISIWKGRKKGVENQEQKQDERFDFQVKYINPQTDNDVFSINHVIAQARELLYSKAEHEDKGNLDVFNNQYIFRKKQSFYGFTFIWKRGEIKSDNFDKDLSYDFATNEYASQIKKIYNCKKIERRKIKKLLEDVVGKIKKKKILESFELDR